MKLRFTAGWALVLLLSAVLYGCGDNSGSPTGYQPQGTGNVGLLLLDVQPASPDSSQIVLYAEIYDSTNANGYRLYVNPDGQGFRPAVDYVAAPTQTFSTGVNLYRIRALTFDPAADNDYLGRGSRNGLESTAAPLTEHALLSKGFTPIDLARRLDVTLVAPDDSTNLSEVKFFAWDPVPGAVRYRFRVTGRNGIVFEAILTDKFETVMLVENLPVRPGLMRWGVDAIDAQNRLIGITRQQRALLVD